jgi:acetamidase/formamidase
VSAVVQLQVHVIKGLTLDGPVLFPRPDDVPPLARPLDAAELRAATALAAHRGGAVEDDVPVSVIGTGATINAATEVGLDRAAALLGVSNAEVRNRATIAGAIEIGRLPGTVQVTFRAPKALLADRGLLEFAEDAAQRDGAEGGVVR